MSARTRGDALVAAITAICVVGQFLALFVVIYILLFGENPLNLIRG